MARLFLPTQLKSLAGGAMFVDLPGQTVGQVLDALNEQYPGTRQRLCDQNRLKPGTAVTVDGQIATLGLRQAVTPDAEIHILPAIGGG
ncbi:MAG: MoaD/ThiS family protein [Planctomycetales bacterium]|nr:MoaD/ThiS family protein [Planctomycetales bacterium]